MLEPEDEEEELLALEAALAGTRAPTTAIGCIGLGFCSLLVFTGVGALTSTYGDGTVTALVFFGMALIYGIGPSLLLAAGMTRQRDLDDRSAAIRQVRILTVFWWIAVVGMLGTLALNLATFGLGVLMGRGGF